MCLIGKHSSSLDVEDLEVLSKKFKSMAKCKKYFPAEFQEKDNCPSNAAALVADGTIQVLEVLDNEDEDVWLCYEETSAEKIKMAVEGINEIVQLGYIQHGGKHTWTMSVSFKIGDLERKYAWGDCSGAPRARDSYFSHSRGPSRIPCNITGNDPKNMVLQMLHKALGIPEHERKEMINLLFFPYSVHVDKTYEI